MDTRDPIFQEALDELYLCLMKVFRLAGRDTNQEQQLQHVIAALGKLTQGSATAVRQTAMPTDYVTQQQSRPVATVPPVEAHSSHTAPVDPVFMETRYATAPEQRDSDGQWGFRNKYLDNDDDDTHYYKILIIDENSAHYELKASAASACENDPQIAPEEVVTGSALKHDSVQVLSCGTLVRDGKFWIVQTPCRVKWS